MTVLVALITDFFLSPAILSPGDVRGTALLTFTHKVGDDEQWLYLPALKRVKRISFRNKSGAFMGSEFSYEDLGSREVEKYSYSSHADQQIDTHTCFVVELFPKDARHSGYSRIVSWVDQAEYRTLREDYYDKKNRLLKTLNLREYQQYLGFVWRPHRMEMLSPKWQRDRFTPVKFPFSHWPE